MDFNDLQYKINAWYEQLENQPADDFAQYPRITQEGLYWQEQLMPFAVLMSHLNVYVEVYNKVVSTIEACISLYENKADEYENGDPRYLEYISKAIAAGKQCTRLHNNSFKCPTIDRIAAATVTLEAKIGVKPINSVESVLEKERTTFAQLNKDAPTNPIGEPAKDSHSKNWGKWMLKIIAGLIALFIITKTCTDTEDDAYHDAINSTNIELSEKYLKDYPKGKHVAEVKKHIAEYEEYQRYKDNSLYTGSLPYSEYYGRNYSSWLNNCSKITVTAPTNSDVVVTARKTSNEQVVGHIYIKQGETASFVFPAGTYTIYFYYGKGWNPHKVLQGRHGLVNGGFCSDTTVGKDENVYFPANSGYTYTLQLQKNGNFSTKHSSVEEMF